jgi:hypothetical protein
MLISIGLECEAVVPYIEVLFPGLLKGRSGLKDMNHWRWPQYVLFKRDNSHLYTFKMTARNTYFQSPACFPVLIRVNINILFASLDHVGLWTLEIYNVVPP